MSKADSKKATSHSSNYQDCATAPVGHEFDDEAIQQEGDENENGDEDESRLEGILLVVLSFDARTNFFQLRKII